MTDTNIEKLKYPIGKFEKPSNITTAMVAEWITVIEIFPTQLKVEVNGLTEEQLDTPYRPEGWTIRQVVHHLADSHINAYTRFKLALTEDNPTVKPYMEDRWALLSEAKNAPIDASLKILEGIHERWVATMKSMTEDQQKKTFGHPEHGRLFYLDETAGLYAWHGRHHLGHIQLAKQNFK